MKVNTEKTKSMRCRKEGGRWRKTERDVREVKEVSRFKYLGYTIMGNDKQDAQREQAEA